MIRPFFSIVIPTYNRAALLERLLHQVLAQTFTDFECIVVDDGSTDHTGQVVAQFHDERIIYIKKENGERGAARNTGFSQSNGKYINFFDSDDLMLPHHLETAHQFILERQPDAFHSAYELVDESGHVQMTFKHNGDELNTLLLRKNLLSINGLFFTREVVSQFPFVEDRTFKIGEDWLVWINISLCYRILHQPKVTSQIMQHDDRTMSIPAVSDLRVSYDLFHRHLHSTIHRSALNNIRFEQLSLISMFLAVEHRRWEAVRYLMKALKHNPLRLFSIRFLVICVKLLPGT